MRTRLSLLVIASLILGLISLSPAANSLNTNLEIQAITDSDSGKVRLTFNSKIARASVRSYQITATPNTPNAASYSKTFTRKVSGYVLQRIPALTPGIDYKFRVSIRTTKNRVINSAYFNFYTRSIKPTTPLITRAFETDSDEAVVYFDAPANDGGTPVLYYTAKANPGNSTGTTLQRGSGSITITGLTKSTTYTFTVTAHNINGASVESKPSLPVTTLANKIIRVAPAASGPTLAAPAFTLSSSSQSVTVNSAITTVTNTPTGGTIASYAISPAAPAGLTFSTSTGQLSGTPTSTQSSTAYTITATNATGSATRTFTLTVTAIVYAAPAFTLSLAAETKTVGILSTGYSITETGGTATYAISPALPAGLSFSTSNGLITGRATETRTATTHTITATNATGSASNTYRLRVNGDLGDVGPGGGRIFYYSAAGFNCGANFTDTGSPTGEKCRYLEAAPSGWNTGNDPQRRWANTTYQSTTVNNSTSPETATATAIGWGYRNTRAIILQGNSDTATSAAALADSHTVTVSGVAYDDWYLPSKDELNQMCKWQRGITGSALTTLTTVCVGGILNDGTGASGFGEGYYWSSSEGGSGLAGGQNSLNGKQNNVNKSNTHYVRPVRAF
jgi:hypothetical protein